MPYQRLPTIVKNVTSKFGGQMRQFSADAAGSARLSPAQMAQIEEAQELKSQERRRRNMQTLLGYVTLAGMGATGIFVSWKLGENAMKFAQWMYEPSYERKALGAIQEDIRLLKEDQNGSRS